MSHRHRALAFSRFPRDAQTLSLSESINRGQDQKLSPNEHLMIIQKKVSGPK